MKLSPENLSLLGLAADANEETINAKLAAELAKPKEKAPEPKPVADPVATAVSMTAEKISELVDRHVEEKVNALRRKDKAESFAAQLAREGRIVTAQKGDAEALMLANPEAFERFMGSVKKGSAAPVAEIVELDGDEPKFPGAERSGNDDELTRITRLARERGVSPTQAATLSKPN